MAVFTVTKDNFESEVLHSDVPVLVDFWASWCGPCRMLSPLVDQYAAESGAKVGKINVDEEGELAMRYGIMSIPCLKVFKGGEVVNESVGLISKAQIAALMQV